MGFVVKSGDKYSARLVIPKALRPILGQNELKEVTWKIKQDRSRFTRRASHLALEEVD